MIMMKPGLLLNVNPLRLMKLYWRNSKQQTRKAKLNVSTTLYEYLYAHKGSEQGRDIRMNPNLFEAGCRATLPSQCKLGTKTQARSHLQLL